MELDPTSLKMQVRQRQPAESDAGSWDAYQDISGLYGYLDEVLVAVYTQSDQLYLLARGKVVMWSDQVCARARTMGSRRILLIKDGDQDFASIDYAVDESWRLEGDYTAVIEEGDFDFGVFLAGLGADSTRRRGLSIIWSSRTMPDRHAL